MGWPTNKTKTYIEAPEDYSLTPEQEKAFKALERAFNKCASLNIYTWDNYGSISAVNSDVINHVCPDNSYEALIDDDMVSWFSPKKYYGSSSDDQLYVNFNFQH